MRMQFFSSFLFLLQTIQGELQGIEHQLHSLSQVVTSLHSYLSESAADDVNRELRVLREELSELDNETAHIAGEIASTRDSSSEPRAWIVESDSQLQAADQRVAELRCKDAYELTLEDTVVEVS